MAEVGIISRFKAIHGKEPHEHEFKAEAIVEGKIDKKTGYVAGLDHYSLANALKEITAQLANKNLRELLSKEGFKSSGNEAIASHILKQLKQKHKVKLVRVWETEQKHLNKKFKIEEEPEAEETAATDQKSEDLAVCMEFLENPIE